MKLDFYYFSFQCPLNYDMLQLLEAYEDIIDISIHDIANDFALAKDVKMFFPSLAILNGERRYYSPINKKFLDSIVNDIYPVEKTYSCNLAKKEYAGEIQPLLKSGIYTACQCCGHCTEANTRIKGHFLNESMDEPYGFLNLGKDGALLGGAEYMPSTIIPYDVPRDEKTAFITCVYMSDSKYDYKSAPLLALENYLHGRFKKIIAISDEIGIFPNGNLDFFLRNGYRDNGIIYEDHGYCRLHLVSKELI